MFSVTLYKTDQNEQIWFVRLVFGLDGQYCNPDLLGVIANKCKILLVFRLFSMHRYKDQQQRNSKRNKLSDAIW